MPWFAAAGQDPQRQKPAKGLCWPSRFFSGPEVIILNEPARGVDIGTNSGFYRQINRLVERGGAVLLISSEIEASWGFTTAAS